MRRRGTSRERCACDRAADQQRRESNCESATRAEPHSRRRQRPLTLTTPMDALDASGDRLQVTPASDRHRSVLCLSVPSVWCHWSRAEPSCDQARAGAGSDSVDAHAPPETCDCKLRHTHRHHEDGRTGSERWHTIVVSWWRCLGAVGEIARNVPMRSGDPRDPPSLSRGLRRLAASMIECRHACMQGAITCRAHALLW